MLSEGHVPFEEVFNFMIAREISFEDDTKDDAKFNPLLWIQEMVNNFKIRPSIHTFNVLFKSISQVGKFFRKNILGWVIWILPLAMLLKKFAKIKSDSF